MIDWSAITKEDVVKSIEKFEFDKGKVMPNNKTYVIYNGKKYPAKRIRGIAYAIHFNKELTNDDFGGGLESALFFERLGFEAEYHGDNKLASKVLKCCKNKGE